MHKQYDVHQVKVLNVFVLAIACWSKKWIWSWCFSKCHPNELIAPVPPGSPECMVIKSLHHNNNNTTTRSYLRQIYRVVQK